jgi:hypothetical protein
VSSEVDVVGELHTFHQPEERMKYFAPNSHLPNPLNLYKPVYDVEKSTGSKWICRDSLLADGEINQFLLHSLVK